MIENPIELEIEIRAKDASEEDLDWMTRNLLEELRETDVESVNLVSSKSAPKGSKGDPITIGAIALVALPSLLPKIVELVNSWVQRGSGRTVKFKGEGIEFEGSPEELHKLLAMLEKRKKEK